MVNGLLMVVDEHSNFMILNNIHSYNLSYYGQMSIVMPFNWNFNHLIWMTAVIKGITYY